MAKRFSRSILNRRTFGLFRGAMESVSYPTYGWNILHLPWRIQPQFIEIPLFED